MWGQDPTNTIKFLFQVFDLFPNLRKTPHFIHQVLQLQICRLLLGALETLLGHGQCRMVAHLLEHW